MINSIRKKGGLLVGTVAISLIFFILSQGIRGVMPFLYGKKNDFTILEVAGHKLNFHEFDKNLNRYKSELAKRKEKPQENTQALLIKEYIRQMVEQYMYPKEYEKLGLIISEEELIDMIQGEHIHPLIKRLFINKETKEFDKEALLNFLQTLDKRSEQEQARYFFFESRIKKIRLVSKFNSLMSNSIYITDIELENENIFEYSSLDLKALFVSFDNISDKGIKITENMLKTYLTENQEKYKIKESIDISYARFPIMPSEVDEEEIKNEIEGLVEKFKKADDSVAFAQTHTDGSIVYTHQTFKYRDLRKKFPKIRRWRRGQIVGPIKETDNVYRLYKLFKIIQRKRGGFDYEMAIIEKHIVASDKTKDNIYRKADVFSNNIKTKKQFDEETKNQNIETHYAKQIFKDAINIGELKNARRIVKWLYNKDTKNKISPVFEVDNEYIVAIPTKYSKEGLVDLEYLRDEITKEVLKKEKSKIIKSKINLNPETSLKNIVKEYGKEAKLIKLKNIHFKDNSLGKIGEVEKAIGIAFSLKNKGDRSKAFADKNGVIVFELDKRSDSNIENQESHKLSDLKAEVMMEPYNVYLALEDLADVKNYKNKFY